jgi:Na+/H+ antiporter NhaD/arsenite permease-like protein
MRRLCGSLWSSSAARRIVPAALALGLGAPESALGADAGAADAPGGLPSFAWTLPFVSILLAIAVFPLIDRLSHWWEHNSVKLGMALLLGGLVLWHYGTRGYGIDHGGHLTAPGAPTLMRVLEHAILDDYVPFMALLFSLYVIAGGIQMRGDVRALPSVNTLFLGLGAAAASFVGTTGASMVLIRPLLQTNQERTRVRHTVIFFIFLVSNIGGSLLPIGDPPLFLGYLKGVPFLWTLSLWGPWAFSTGALLLVYYVWDRFFEWPREPALAQLLDRRMIEPIRVRGIINLLWLLGVVLAVALLVPGRSVPGLNWVIPRFFREGVLLALTAVSLATTPRGLRQETQFNYHAILEVAALFLGIFLTMQVPLELLRAGGSQLGVRTPTQFFWWTGLLSSFLDNAPTYLVFLAIAEALPTPAGTIPIPLNDGSVTPMLLRAIALGAVFMGANTYIGNGPNFMVKSIAERQGVRMPSFFGYMAYSGLVLIPLFIVVNWLFLR